MHINFETPTRLYPLAVYCRLGTQKEEILSLIDTGSELSIIGAEIAEDLADDLGPRVFDQQITISSRFGSLVGYQHQLEIVFPSLRDFGTDLRVFGKVIVLEEDWPYCVLGMGGCLESMRFAIEPSQFSPVMYFSSAN